jgi:hypothetical protein
MVSEDKTEDRVNRAWLLLAVGDDRQHGGNEGYDDAPESHYSWDSTVPNHAVMAVGDPIALWDKRQLLGASVIEAIDVGEATKSLYSCAACGRASIKARKHMSPRYKCYSCKAVFEDPVKRETVVTTYRSRHDVGWVDLAGTLSASELRTLCVSRSSQLSLRPLRWDDFVTSLDQLPKLARLTVVTARAEQLAGGHKIATVRVRVGQASFRKLLLERFGAACAVTGPAPAPALEACHLYSYSTVGVHHVHGGLLLRRDVHRLFDLGYLAVNPTTLTIDVAAPLDSFPIYAGLDGQALQTPVTSTHREWFREHWRQHRSTG